MIKSNPFFLNPVFQLNLGLEKFLIPPFLRLASVVQDWVELDMNMMNETGEENCCDAATAVSCVTNM